MPLPALARADALYVRAMDEGMNTQPRDMYVVLHLFTRITTDGLSDRYLNAMSMLNNW